MYLNFDAEKTIQTWDSLTGTVVGRIGKAMAVQTDEGVTARIRAGVPVGSRVLVSVRHFPGNREGYVDCDLDSVLRYGIGELAA